MSTAELTLTEPAAAEFKAVVDVFSAATNPAAGYAASAASLQLGDGGAGGFAGLFGGAAPAADGGAAPSGGDGGGAPAPSPE